MFDIYIALSAGPAADWALGYEGLKSKSIESVQWRRDELTLFTFLFLLTSPNLSCPLSGLFL